MALLGIDICGAIVDRLGERFKGYLGTGEASRFLKPKMFVSQTVAPGINKAAVPTEADGFSESRRVFVSEYTHNTCLF